MSETLTEPEASAASGRRSDGRTKEPAFSPETLRIDAGREADRISRAIREQVLKRLRRRGVVLGLSGGIDSSVTAALCVKALGAKKVVALLMRSEEHTSELQSH